MTEPFVPYLDDDRPFNPTPYLMQFALRDALKAQRGRTADQLPNPFDDIGDEK
jgi:hypothetical protein